MDLVQTILTVVLAVMLLASAMGKLSKQQPVVENMAKAGVNPDQFPALAALQILGAIGLVLGFWWEWIGIAAAIGVVLYFVGAVAAHIRNGDRQVAVPAGLLVLAVVVLWLMAG